MKDNTYLFRCNKCGKLTTLKLYNPVIGYNDRCKYCGSNDLTIQV